MTKSKTIFASILLMGSAIAIEFLLNQRIANHDEGLFGFFSGLLFGAGLAIFIQTIFRGTSHNK